MGIINDRSKCYGGCKLYVWHILNSPQYKGPDYFSSSEISRMTINGRCARGESRISGNGVRIYKGMGDSLC